MASLVRTLPGGILDTGNPVIQDFYEAASQTFKAGDPVDVTSGKVTIVVAYGNTLGANDDIMGFALEDASGTTDNKIRVLLITKPTLVRLPVMHATAASAITAVTQVGTAYELTLDANGILGVQIDATTNVKGKVASIAPSYPVGEQYGLVDFMLDPAQTVFPGT